jgi:hypothetical protein
LVDLEANDIGNQHFLRQADDEAVKAMQTVGV